MAGQALLTIKDRQWAVDIASTFWELTQGLGGLSGLPTGTGMLFDMGYEKTIEVTTVPMLFPLDIAFLSDDLTITEVYRNVAPGYLVTSQIPARYFIEVNAGELTDIQPGDQAEVSLLSVVSVSTEADWTSVMFGFMGFVFMGMLMITLVHDLNEEDRDQVLKDRAPAVIIKHWREPKRNDELDLLPDSPEFLAYTIDDIGFRDIIDSAFKEAITRARGLQRWR